MIHLVFFRIKILIDVGITVGNAIKLVGKKPNDINKIKEQALSINSGSQSNGSLMRITPLAVWTHKLSEDDLEKAVRAEVTFSHPNETAQRAAVCYCLCIKYLIEYKHFHKGAIQKVMYLSYG